MGWLPVCLRVCLCICFSLLVSAHTCLPVFLVMFKDFMVYMSVCHFRFRAIYETNYTIFLCIFTSEYFPCLSEARHESEYKGQGENESKILTEWTPSVKLLWWPVSPQTKTAEHDKEYCSYMIRGEAQLYVFMGIHKSLFLCSLWKAAVLYVSTVWIDAIYWIGTSFYCYLIKENQL